MRRHVCWFFALFCLLVATLPAEIRVATFNLKNYLVQDRRVEGRWMPDYPKPESEKQAVQRAILEIDADILALQEMGPSPFLAELQQDLKDKGLNYPHAVHFRAEDENRHLAVLSKIAPDEVLRHTDMDFPYFGDRLRVKRGLLEVVFENDGQRWSLFVVHLKSRWTDEPQDPASAERRRKEARAARNRILERYPDAKGLYLIVGDFNDHRESAPLRRFLRRGDIEISERVESFDSRGEKWTFYYDDWDRYDRVDFILASPEMAERVKGGRGSILDSLYLFDGTDHRPVFLDLLFPE